MYEREKSMMSIMPAFIIGGLIGAGIALLMAPQSGQQTRSMIMDRSNQLKERAAGTVDETRGKVQKTVDDITTEAKDRISSVKTQAQERM